MMKRIDADYYGYRDEDDGVLVPLEVDHEKQSKYLAEVAKGSRGAGKGEM